MKKKFDVTGMSCAACSEHIRKNLMKTPGIAGVAINLLKNEMTVEWDADEIDAQGIVDAVKRAGYGAALKDAKGASGGRADGESETQGMKRRFLLSLFFLVPLFYISMGHMLGFSLPPALHGMENALTFAFVQFLLVMPIVFINFHYYTSGFGKLFRGSPNMDSLIAIGSSAAVIYGTAAIFLIGYGLGHMDSALVEKYSMDLYFESAGMILTLITLGKYFETRAKGKTSQAIAKLMDLAPKTAVVVRQDAETEIPVEDVVRGDIVLVAPGQRIPVDGVVTQGSSAVDESAITGESIPVPKKSGDKVVAATINGQGAFRFRAEKVGNETVLARIIQLVEDAVSSKAPISRLADRISGIFVPVVIAIAVAAMAIWLALGYPLEFALSIGIAVLVISCPCALGLATPVAIMVGTGKGAQGGILFKNAQSLETAQAARVVVLDKTGTITQGRPIVTEVITVAGRSQAELLSIAASVERHSEHPLAEAVIEEAKRKGAKLLPAEDFAALPGRGVMALVSGRKIMAGNLTMMREADVDLQGLDLYAEKLAAEGKSLLFFAEAGSAIGLFAVADTVKPTSKAAVEALAAMGLEVVMLTGDNAITAEAIRKQLGIARAIAGVMPQDKEKEIAALQAEGKTVVMIGDGINDAPALARADVGMAIGAGTDIAIESADIVLMKSDLMDAVWAFRLSRAVMRNIRQNLFWAFFYNMIGIPVAAGLFYGWLGLQLSPMIAAAAMSLSSIFVVTNALRLRLFRFSGKLMEGGACPVQGCNINKKGEDERMEKTIDIEGMSCAHCTGRVEKALNAIEGVHAKVSLEENRAVVSLSREVSDDQLREAIEDAGYTVTGIR